VLFEQEMVDIAVSGRRERKRATDAPLFVC